MHPQGLCPVLGSTIILLEERSISLVVLRCPHRNFWVLTVELGQDFGRKMAQSPGTSLRPLPPSFSCLSQFHLNRTGRREGIQSRRHPGCTGSHPVGAGVPRVGEGQDREEPAAAHGEHGQELPAGSPQVAINQSGKLAPTKGKEGCSQQLPKSAPEGAEPEAGYK